MDTFENCTITFTELKAIPQDFNGHSCQLNVQTHGVNVITLEDLIITFIKLISFIEGMVILNDLMGIIMDLKVNFIQC